MKIMENIKIIENIENMKIMKNTKNIKNMKNIKNTNKFLNKAKYISLKLSSILLIIAVLFSILLFSTSNLIGEDAKSIVKEMEQRINYDGDFTADLTLVQKDPEAADKILKAKYYRRDKDDKFVLIFTYPDSEKGKGYLRIGDNFWMYLPSTREFVHKSRKEKVGSTDAKGEVFEKKKIEELYNVKLLGSKKISKWDTFVIELKAKELDVSYPIQKMYIRKDIYTPVKVEAYSLSKTLMQTQYFIKYEKIGNNKYVATKMLIINNLEKGKQTLVQLTNISTKKIPDSYFTKAFLENQSR